MAPQSQSTNESQTQTATRIGWLAIPGVIFLLLAVLFAFALTSGDPSKLPSALIGKPVPQLTYEPLEGLKVDGAPLPGFSNTNLASGRVSVVNFWASWCGPCIQEHPLLVALAKTGKADIYGINYKDKPSNARRFIGRYGNPYKALGIDPDGRAAIEWGVYGMPETYVVDGRGRIAYKHVGPISRATLEARILPAIEKAGRAGTATSN